MNKIFLLILTACIFTSCSRTSNKAATDVENKIDTTQKVLYVKTCYRDSFTYEGHTYEGYTYEEFFFFKHITDSLRKVVQHIQRNRNISTVQRINRIRELYHSTGLGSVWTLRLSGSDLNLIDPYDLVATEIGLLLADPNIVNYDIDSIFATIFSPQSGSIIIHSEDNRLWAVSFIISAGGNGNIPANVIVWRDTCNKPQGFVSSYSEAFEHLESLASWNEIYKLNDTGDKNLYLVLGESKGAGNNAIVIELTHNGINLKYRGFQTKENIENIEYFDAYKSINGKVIVYNLGIDWTSDDYNYKFNKENQTISFRKSSRYWFDNKMDTLTIGTLTFNGKYFTERLKKQKYDVNE